MANGPVRLEEVARYYSTKLAEHGDTARGVDWNGEESQALRFDQLARIIQRDSGFSLNDLGCGYGALFDYLASRFEQIPADTDIVVAHGPPRGYGDRTSDGAHVGAAAMTATLTRVQPQLMVCGHIHPAYGRYRLGATEIINASLVDNRYQPVNPVVEIQL